MLFAAKLRPFNIDAGAGTVELLQRMVPGIRGRFPKIRIILRADSGLARPQVDSPLFILYLFIYEYYSF